METTYDCGCFVSGAIQMCKVHAAAPELLEALEGLLGLIIRIQERTPIYESDGQIYRAEAAIRKAKGE